jgi:hypothetical protein
VSSDKKPQGKDLVTAFLDRIRATDMSVLDLYNDDGELCAGGTTYRGRDSIQEFYVKSFANTSESSQVSVRRLIGEPPVIAALLDVNTGKGSSMSVVDVFTLEGDGIASLHAYYDMAGLRAYGNQ